MSRSPLKRALGVLRKLVRRGRAPGPSEHQWLRLILLVRRLQHGQFAFAQRLDEIRVLTGQLGSFRSDFSALHEQLASARETAGELERGLAERLGKLDALPDPEAERAALEQRLAALDALAGRLERLAGQAPVEVLPTDEVGALLAQLDELAGRFEASAAAERSAGGQNELAQLYERIQELADGLASSGGAAQDAAPFAPASDEALASISAQLAHLEGALEELIANAGLANHDETLTRLERLEQRLERRLEKRGPARGAASAAPEELIPLVARLEELTLRLEQSPATLPELPDESLVSEGVSARDLEELRIQLACEQESRRRVDSELESSRERLRSSELARVELETRHTTEMAQMADHVARQLQRVEDDLKKKKRGLAELTQQNLALQNRLSLLQGTSVPVNPPEPPPALPSSAPKTTPAPQPAPEPEA